MRISRIIGLSLMTALVWARSAHACSVCFGEPGSPMALGLSWGVGALLAVVLSVLGTFAAFFIYLARRASRVARAMEPETPAPELPRA